MTPHDPEFRAAVASAVLTAVMIVPGAVTVGAVLKAAKAAVRMPEENCAAEVYAAIGLFVRAGVILSSTFDGTSSRISGGTMLTASRALGGFAWADELTGGYPA